jgi:hypothetical protein
MQRPLLTLIGILLNCVGLWFLAQSIIHQAMASGAIAAGMLNGLIALLLINGGILLMIAGFLPRRRE